MKFVSWLGQALLLTCGVAPAQAGLLPDLDPSARSLGASFADIFPPAYPDQAGYFDAPIEKKVHQIWFGNPARMCTHRVQAWRAFAAKFGYAHRLWTEQDDDEVAGWMPAQHFALYRKWRTCGRYLAASDLLRLYLLRREGGIYCDVDMAPPMRDGQLVDAAEVFPMRGLILMTENFGRNMGNGASYYANGLMMAAANHPMFVHLTEGLDRSVARQLALHGADALCAAVASFNMVGPPYLNRSLQGVFTTLPITYARRLGMVADGKWDVENPADYTTDEVGGLAKWLCQE